VSSGSWFPVYKVLVIAAVTVDNQLPLRQFFIRELAFSGSPICVQEEVVVMAPVVIAVVVAVVAVVVVMAVVLVVVVMAVVLMVVVLVGR
jgi:hypothetical protein